MTSTPYSKLPVIVGLDALGGDRLAAARLARSLCGHVSGYKIGLPGLLADPGLPWTVRSSCPDSLIVADLKLADIGDTMVRVARYAAPWADAVIAHAFPGYEGALDELSRFLSERGVRLVVVVAMSNPGARETMDPALEILAGIAERAGAWGVVAPATRPAVIGRVRRLLPKTVILAPGVGAQGARPGDAIRAGADFEIIGRMIAAARDPLGVVEGLRSVYGGILGEETGPGPIHQGL